MVSTSRLLHAEYDTDHLHITTAFAFTVYEPTPDDYEPDPIDPEDIDGDDIIDDFKNIWGPDATTVGRHRMVLSNRSPITGHPQISYVETPADVIVINRESAARVGLPIGGIYVRLAAVGFTYNAWRPGDRLFMLDGTRYRVQSVIPIRAGNKKFIYLLELDEMPLKEW